MPPSTAQPNGPVTFAEIGPGDKDELAAFFRANNVPEVTRTFHPFPLTVESADRIASLPRRDHYYGAFAGKRIVGLAMLRGWDEGYAIPSFGIVVDVLSQKQGLGGALLDYTLAQARHLGCPHVRLTVYASNTAAVHLYRVRGFDEVSREPDEAAGQPELKIVMVKELNRTD